MNRLRTLLALIAILVMSTGCAAFQIHDDAFSAYERANTALEKLDAIESAHLESLVDPTADELLEAARQIDRLRRARTCMIEAREALKMGELSVARDSFVCVLDTLGEVSASLERAGVKVPPEVARTLAAVRAVTILLPVD